MINNWRPAFIPINNKEIESFYDPHWNIPKDYQRNWLLYISERMKGEELSDIIAIVEKRKSNKDWAKDIDYKWKEIEKYNKFRAIEEAAQRKKKQKFSQIQKQIKRFGLKTSPLTFEELEKLDKEDKQEAKKKIVSPPVGENLEVSTEEKEQNEELTIEPKPPKKSHGKKSKKK